MRVLHKTFTSALYSLAAEPEKYIEPLRQEVIEHLEDGEITYNTLHDLPKMQSFLRESARMNVAGLSKLLHPPAERPPDPTSRRERV